MFGVELAATISETARQQRERDEAMNNTQKAFANHVEANKRNKSYYDIQAIQAEFMDACEQPRRDTPITHQDQLRGIAVSINLWTRLIEEEYTELMREINHKAEPGSMSFYEINAALCAEATDLVYVTMGLMNALGLPFMPMFEAVHAANMAKCVDGKVIKNADGKVLKPHGWVKANTVEVIKDALKNV